MFEKYNVLIILKSKSNSSMQFCCFLAEEGRPGGVG
jgi:hypothetical protein